MKPRRTFSTRSASGSRNVRIIKHGRRSTSVGTRTITGLPRIAFLPVVDRPSRYRFNVVPRDFIIDAIDSLSAHGEAKCYQLADPAPLTVDETIDTIARATGHTIVRIPLPKSVAKFAVDRVPGVYRLMCIPSAAIDYFVHPTTYDTTNTQRDLALRVPRFADYAPRLIDFVRAHPEIGSPGMA